MIKLSIGTRVHDVSSKTSINEIVNKLHQLNFKDIQLVAYKSIEGLDDENYKINDKQINEIKNCLNSKGINISILGSYFNLVTPNKADFDLGYNRFVEYLSYGKKLGCNYIATETGSLNPDYSYNANNKSEDAFNKSVLTIKKLCKEASKHDVYVTIEVVWSHVISDTKKMKKLLDSVDSDRIRVIFDPVNMLNMDNYYLAKDIIDDVFKLYGEKIVAIHAKDFIIEKNSLKPVQIGKGLLDYDLILKLLKDNRLNIPIIIEELTGKELIDSYNYLNNKLNIDY